MKFLYCRECGNMRPRGWFMPFRRCEVCSGTMEPIKVKMTAIAPAYYAVTVATLAVLALYLLDYAIPFGVWTIIVLTAATMILAFIDYSISYDRAKEVVKTMKKD